MRVDRLSFALTAALALTASPAYAKAAPKPVAKPAAAAVPSKPAPKPDMVAPTKPKPALDECCTEKPAPAKDDCCAEKPDAAAKPAAPMAKDACCAKGGECDGSCMEDMKKPHAMAPMKGANKMEACCEDGMGDCCSAEKPHGPQMGRPGMGHGMMAGRHPMWVGSQKRNATRGTELRFMPAAAAGSNMHIVYGRDGRWQINPYFSMGHQMNWALQLMPTAAGQGNWFTPYGGILPRVGFPIGKLRADIGVLGGFGTMLRTGTVGTATDALQARVMWVVEPRVELGWQGEHMGAGIVGTYNLNPNMSEFGGPSVGLRFTFKKMGWM